MRGFANPPWCLIAHCLSQVKRQVARVVMVTPLWTSQPWYPTLRMLEDFPRILPAQIEQAFIINQGISGMAHIRESFTSRGISAEACYHPGDQKVSQTTTRFLQNGLASVHKGIGIP